MQNAFQLTILLLLATLPFSVAQAQMDLQRYDQIPVVIDGTSITNPWVGGHNFCQFGNIDLDLDGTLDLFVFDRTGDKVACYLQQGSSGQEDLVHTAEYDQVYPFPELRSWVLFADYNCDGKEDIFTYAVGGVAVYKNISNDQDGLQFKQTTDLVLTNYVPSTANLFVTSTDLPAIVDVDNDGDMDILTFSILGSYVEYHKNMSMEKYGHCDSLNYQVTSRCWGNFSESINTNSVNLQNPCGNNIDMAELPLLVEEYTQRLKQGQDEQELIEEIQNNRSAHVGSTLLSFDGDGDGVKELLLGDVSYENLVFLFNGGTVDANDMVAQDTAFPVYDVPVDVFIFPGPFYEDIDNDGVRDLIVSPNARNLSQNFESIWYYRNNGTDDFPDFEFQRPNLLQDQAIEVGEGAIPIFFDHDGDGLMDLLLGNHGYFQEGGNFPSMVAYFRNTGTNTSPEYELITRDYQDLSNIGIGQSLHPAFGDLDGDGDKDMLVGEVQGKLHYFENEPVGGEASFTLTMPNIQDNNGIIIDIGQFSAPQIFDVDRDGVLDLLVGERNGNINYYRNIGSTNNPSFQLVEDTLGGVVVSEWWNITGHAAPLMFENDNGEYELLVGSEAGYVWHFDDIDGNLGGQFQFQDSLFQSIDEGPRSHVAMHDFDDDGLMDLMVGNYRGGVTPYKNVFGVGIAERLDHERLMVVPNPTNNLLTVELSLFNNATVEVELYDVVGHLLDRASLKANNTWRYQAAHLAKGHYTFLFRSAGRTAVAAFIKE